MKNKLILLAFVLLGLFFGAHSAEEDVIVLTDSNFDDIVNAQDIILVEFYAPWCGHCKKLAPEYEKAAGILKANDPPIPIAKVDCTVETEVAGRFGIRGYPTLKIFKNGNPTDYEGPRTADGIVKYMQSRVGPSAKTLATREEVETFLAKNNGDSAVVIGFFQDTSSAHSTFMRTADELRDKFKFAVVVSQDEEELFKKYGIEKNGAVVFKPQYHFNEKYDETAYATLTSFKQATLKTFIYDNALNLVSEYTSDNSFLFEHHERPVFVFYFDECDFRLNRKGSNYYANRIRKVAKDFSDKLVFGVANAKSMSGHLERYGLANRQLVATIEDGGKKYRFDGDFSPENIKAFVQSFVDKKAEPWMKSEEVPKSQDGPVSVVVGKTFDEIVNDPDRDVLIEFYAPWCGHCKTLAPKYDELGRKLAGVDHITIAKIDATANDIPDAYQVTGFPTIYFAKAGSKDRPMRYNGDREVDDFLSFLKKESIKPFEVEEKKSGKKKSKKDKEEL